VPQRPDYHPEIDTGVHVLMVLDMSARLQAPLAVRFACLVHDLGKGTTPVDMLPRHIGHEERSVKLLKGVCERLRIPVDCKRTRRSRGARARQHPPQRRLFRAPALVRLLERCDAFRKPARFGEILLACECDARGRLGFEHAARTRSGTRLAGALTAAQAVDTADIAQQAMGLGLSGPKVGERIHAARVAAVGVWLAAGSPGIRSPETQEKPRAPKRDHAAFVPDAATQTITARSWFPCKLGSALIWASV
jgi:tRNA nucleotidyltransferase (CCA-adding enzyme)